MSTEQLVVHYNKLAKIIIQFDFSFINVIV
jgi:hypothetical protein